MVETMPRRAMPENRQVGILKTWLGFREDALASRILYPYTGS